MNSKDQDLPQIHVGTGWVYLTIESEPIVVLTGRGYAPALRVVGHQTQLTYILYIGARSLSLPLESIRLKHGGVLGRRIKLRKTSTDRTSTYEVQEIGM